MSSPGNVEEPDSRMPEEELRSLSLCRRTASDRSEAVTVNPSPPGTRESICTILIKRKRLVGL